MRTYRYAIWFVASTAAWVDANAADRTIEVTGTLGNIEIFSGPVFGVQPGETAPATFEIVYNDSDAAIVSLLAGSSVDVPFNVNSPFITTYDLTLLPISSINTFQGTVGTANWDKADMKAAVPNDNSGSLNDEVVVIEHRPDGDVVAFVLLTGGPAGLDHQIQIGGYFCGLGGGQCQVIGDHQAYDSTTNGIGQILDVQYFFGEPTPGELLEDLATVVLEINLQAGISNPLDAKLDSALMALDDTNANNDGAALNSIYAFCNNVAAQRGKKLTDEQADQLIAGANGIIVSLDETAPLCQ